MKKYAVIGLSCNLPEARNYIEFWKNLTQGKGSVRELNDIRKKEVDNILDLEEIAPAGYLDEISKFDYQFFGISKGEAIRMEPEQRLLLHLAYNTVLNASYAVDEIKATKTGVFLSQYESEYSKIFHDSSAFDMPGHLQSMSVTRIARFLDLRGPAYVVDTACSSVLSALKLACQNIELGECDQAFVGGVTLNIPTFNNYKESPVISDDFTCRAFDIDANGTIGGEGGTMFLIKSLEKAKKDGDHIWAVIKNVKSNHCGSLSQSVTSPSPLAQRELIKDCLQEANVNIGSVSAIECHGTGTVLGDPIEVKALSDALGERDEEDLIRISSVKTNFGHLGNAAGGAGLLKAILQLKNKELAPSLNFRKLNPAIQFENENVKVQTEHEAWNPKAEIRRIGVTSLGLSGTNVFVLLEEYDEVPLIEVKEKTEPSFFQLNTTSSSTFSRIQKEAIKDYNEQNVPIHNFGDALGKTLSLGQFKGVFTYQNDKEFFTNLNLLDAIDANKGTRVSKVFMVLAEDYELNEAIPALLNSDFNNNQSAYLNAIVDRSENQLLRISKFFHQLMITEKLIEAGLEVNEFLCTGIGKIVSRVIQNEIDVTAAVKEVLIQEENDTFNSDAVIEYVEKIALSDALFVVPFKEGDFSNLIENEIKKWEKKPTYIAFDGSLDNWVSPINELLKRQINFNVNNWNRRQALPLLLPVLKGITCWPYLKEGLEEDETPEKVPEVTIELLDMIDPEKVVEKLWKNLLLVDQIEEDDDFFELGGDSISALEVVNSISKKNGFSIDYDDVFENATFKQLSNLIRVKIEELRLELEDDSQPVEEVDAEEKELFNNLYSIEKVNEAKEGRVPENIYEEELIRENTYNSVIDELKEFKPEQIIPEDILITGVTGFLGVYVLKDLLEKTESTIYCLVRAENGVIAQHRVNDNFKSFFGEKELGKYQQRIIAVKGDITENNIGFSDEDLKRIGDVSMFFNCVAKVVHHGILEDSEMVSVQGTKNMIDLCNLVGVKNFIYTSTLAVCGAGIVGKEVMSLYETDLNRNQIFDKSPYAQTKYRTELYLNEVAESNPELDIRIFRIGFITGDSVSGRFQKNIEENIIYQLLHAVNDLKSVPETHLEYTQEMQPVDVVSNNLVDLSLTLNAPIKTYQLFNPLMYNFADYLRGMRANGLEIEVVTFEKLLENYEIAKTDGDKDLRAFKIIEYSEYNPISVFRFFGGITHQLLKNINGFDWNEFESEEYLNKFIAYMIEIGYLKSVNETIVYES